MRVLKFGGTSVADADAIERLVAIVRREAASDAEACGRSRTRAGLALVVSALGGATDSPARHCGSRAQRPARAGTRAGRFTPGAPSRHGPGGRRRRFRRRALRGDRAAVRAAVRGRAIARGAPRARAAVARCRRGDRRAAEQPHRRGSPRRARRAGAVDRSPPPHRHRQHVHQRRPADAGHLRPRERDARAGAVGRTPAGNRRLRRRDPGRDHDDARTRGFRLLGSHRRRGHRRRRRSRSGRMSMAC